VFPSSDWPFQGIILPCPPSTKSAQHPALSTPFFNNEPARCSTFFCSHPLPPFPFLLFPWYSRGSCPLTARKVRFLLVKMLFNYRPSADLLIRSSFSFPPITPASPLLLRSPSRRRNHPSLFLFLILSLRIIEMTLDAVVAESRPPLLPRLTPPLPRLAGGDFLLYPLFVAVFRSSGRSSYFPCSSPPSSPFRPVPGPSFHLGGQLLYDTSTPRFVLRG